MALHFREENNMSERGYYENLFKATKFFLFGSAARKIDWDDDSHPVDIDVIMIPADPGYTKRLERYALENSGKLDLFFYGGDCLISAYDEHRRIMLSKHTHEAIAEDIMEISFDILINMLEDTVEEQNKRKHVPGYAEEFPREVC